MIHYPLHKRHALDFGTEVHQLQVVAHSCLDISVIGVEGALGVQVQRGDELMADARVHLEQFFVEAEVETAHGLLGLLAQQLQLGRLCDECLNLLLLFGDSEQQIVQFGTAMAVRCVESFQDQRGADGETGLDHLIVEIVVGGIRQQRLEQLFVGQLPVEAA